MSFITDIFSKCSAKNGSHYPDVKFGRFAEPDETDEMVLIRTTADELYKKGEYFDAYITFFEYMLRQGGPAVNLQYDEANKMLLFDLVQGSKIVRGAISSTDVFTWADVAEFTDLDVALMRYLLTRNSEFAYCKFAIYDNVISLLQRCPIKDMSPAAFNEMLSEIAINADSVDDILVESYESLKPIDVENIVPLPESEVNVKIQFLRKWIGEAQQLVTTIENDATKTYVILNALFKILYLISPEGSLLYDFRRIYHIYADGFNAEEHNSPEINFKMLEGLEKIKNMSDSDLAKSIYKVRAVFPEISYMTFAEMAEAINAHFPLVETCADANRYDLVLVMCEYIAGLNHAHHGMPVIAQELLLIFWRVLNQDYFEGLGFKGGLVDTKSQALAAIKISDEIEAVIKKYSKGYQGLTFNTANIDFGIMPNFAYTFLKEFAALNIPV